MDLGGFTTRADHRRVRNAAMTTAFVVFAAFAGAAFGLSRLWLIIPAAIGGSVAYFTHRKVALARTPKGVLEMEDDPRQGPMLTLRRAGHTLHRVPLNEATTFGRTRTVDGAPVRVQVELQWQGRAIIAGLVVPFQGTDDDVDTVVTSTIELDRLGSRTFDALTYDLAKRRGRG